VSIDGTLDLKTVAGSGLRFEGRIDGFAMTYDSGPAATAGNPMHALLGSLAACEAMDVISILRKRRLDVTAYEVEMHGARADAAPRRYVSIELVHRVTGRGVPLQALVEAVRLSEERYCSVHHTLDPALPIVSRCEVIEG